MARFRVDLEYVGTRYSGWQIQKNARTVQGALHEAVRTVAKRTDFESYGAGRTDAGFHALHSAVARSHLYQIARRRTAFGKPFVWWIKDPLDFGALAATARVFE